MAVGENDEKLLRYMRNTYQLAPHMCDLELNELTTLNSKFLDTLEENDGGGDMRKLIECPVCLEIPLPPIYLCERGHIVCTECQERTPNCPLCRSLYCKTRSFVAEGIVEKCMLKCKYAEQGCRTVLKGSEMAVHLKSCDYRPITCVDCNFPDSDINYTEYLNHLIKVHKINGVHEGFGFVLYNMDLTKKIHEGVRYCWPPYYFKDGEQNTFLIRMHVSSTFICAWVSHVGTKEDCKKFEVVIGFHVPRQCLERNKYCFSLTWRGPVNHFREDTYHDIFSHGKGLIIPADTIREVGKVSEVLSEWMYHVNVINITAQPLSPNSVSSSKMATMKSRKECSRSVPYKSKDRTLEVELCKNTNQPELTAETPGLVSSTEADSNKEPGPDDSLNPFLNSP